MKTEEQKQFVIMQQDITHLKNDVSEIKGDVKELISNLDQRFMDMNNHNSSEIVKATMEFQKQMESIARNKANKWVEKMILWGAGILGSALLYDLAQRYINK